MGNKKIPWNRTRPVSSSTQSTQKLKISTILDILNLLRLRELADRVEVNYSPGHDEKALRERILRSIDLEPDRLVENFLGLFELKDLCRQLGLSELGRDPQVLRNRIIGRGTARLSQSVRLPEKVRREFQRERRMLALRWAASFRRRCFNIFLWSVAGGVLAYFLASLFTDMPLQCALFGAGGFISTFIIRFTERGLLSSVLLYGLPMIFASHYCQDRGVFDLQEAHLFRLHIAWLAAVIAGALMGIAQQMDQDG